ncbi:MAG: flagellar basal body-associated FliL family protein [Alphaproteobacteria bacterium]|nr:flagellar basal body-associated FliL family protein [Alphaproteobacteria bacterium]
MRNDRDAGYAKAHMPRIKDTLNIYLRELRLDDLRDRGGLSRLRQEMLIQLSNTLRVVQVKDLLFKDVNVQSGG